MNRQPKVIPEKPAWWTRLGRRVAGARRRATGSQPTREYLLPLPERFGAENIHLRLTVPRLPEGRNYSFSEHVVDRDGNPTDRVIATTLGGFAVSDDLGETWRAAPLQGYARFPVLQSKSLPGGEILFVVLDTDTPQTPPYECNYLVVADAKGRVLQSTRVEGARWHGPRGIDIAGDTLMYAEYTANDARSERNTAPHRPSRVWRSRDHGRTWTMVREDAAIRHYHFLQARPGRVAEWWLTSGDDVEESRIWKSIDDGTTWIDQTGKFGAAIDIESIRYPRRLFRLTDMVWEGDKILWGCDDVLNRTTDIAGGRSIQSGGSRIFRCDPSTGATPEILGVCGPEVRNVVGLADHYCFLTQSTGDTPPRVFLMPKRPAAGQSSLFHLFDVERHSAQRTGFTYSRASRDARNGVFFTFRTPTDVFAAPHRLLKWEVAFL